MTEIMSMMPVMPCLRYATCFLSDRMTHLEMPPLVPISELHRQALLKCCAYLGGLLFGQALPLALGDDERPAYGIPLESISTVGLAAKGAAVPFG